MNGRIRKWKLPPVRLPSRRLRGGRCAFALLGVLAPHKGADVLMECAATPRRDGCRWRSM